MDEPNKLGTHFEQLVRKALHEGRAEAPWVLLRNMNFRQGTPVEGHRAMVAAFAQAGVAARTVVRPMPNGADMDIVLLTPAPPQ